MPQVTMLGSSYYRPKQSFRPSNLGLMYYPRSYDRLGQLDFALADPDYEPGFLLQNNNGEKNDEEKDLWSKAEFIIGKGVDVIDRMFDFKIAKAESDAEKEAAIAAREAAKSGDTFSLADYLRDNPDLLRDNPDLLKEISTVSIAPWAIGGAALVGLIIVVSMSRRRRRR